MLALQQRVKLCMETADREPPRESDSTADERWMTFVELAAARRISKMSAIKLVRRHGWRRQADNEGHVRALVPANWATADEDSAAEGAQDRQADLSSAISTFGEAVSTLREQLSQERERTNAERGRADRMEAERDSMRRREDELRGQLAVEKARAGVLQAAMEKALAEAKEQAVAMRRVEDARRLRGTWARLRVAWHGE
jgi:hypothetical protein